MMTGTWRIALIVYWLLLFGATHLPPIALPKTHVSDKFEHFTAYCVLSILLAIVLGARRGRIALVSCSLTILIACAYGAIDEWTQPIVGRICDLHDWYADALGSIAGASV